MHYFTKFEKLLWLASVLAVTVSYCLFSQSSLLSYIASLIGVTFLILNAKGHPLGQLLTIVFSVLYGIISYSYCYYGEMLTYLGMSAPMALAALLAWLRHPFEGNKAQVEIRRISKKETVLLFPLTLAVTVLFYFLLALFGTANLVPSTLSVTTSFLASYLTFRRSPCFALAYASNDLVLIVLWALASAADRSYLSVLVCFCVFFINDMYGFFNWLKMERYQSARRAEKNEA